LDLPSKELSSNGKPSGGRAIIYFWGGETDWTGALGMVIELAAGWWAAARRWRAK